MILSFATQLNGKPTHFVEKIHKCLINYKFNTYGLDPSIHYTKNYNFLVKDRCSPKVHTIRKDKDDVFHQGEIMKFMTDEDFQFAPEVPVQSTQDIFITRKGYTLEITIAKVDSYIGGEDIYLLHQEKETLAMNDGFDKYEDFVFYFLDKIEQNGKETGNYWYSGKIIHWTDLRY